VSATSFASGRGRGATGRTGGSLSYVEEAFALFGPGGAVMRDWVRAWAEPRPERIPVRGAAELAELAPSAELATWVELFETHALEAADPAEAELRAPGDLPDLGRATGPSAVADLRGLLTASVVIAQQEADKNSKRVGGQEDREPWAPPRAGWDRERTEGRASTRREPELEPWAARGAASKASFGARRRRCAGRRRSRGQRRDS
jgi:hypothetical protein